MDRSDIFVFLLSPDFINSNACKEEWKYAKQLADEGKPVFRIPIILRDCAWIDFLGDDDIKVLPNDGEPVANFDQEDTAWMQVYNGIKIVINELRCAFSPKFEFIRDFEKTDFYSLEHVKLQDIFVFPTLTYYASPSKEGKLRQRKINNLKELLERRYLYIHGEERSGKTTLGRHIFLSLTENQSIPVLYIDLDEISRKPKETIIKDEYYKQFNGDYSLWSQQEGKLLILDNLSSQPRLIELVEYAKEIFDNIIITLSSDIFNSFFIDEKRLSDFDEMRIEPLSHQQQETLIRKVLSLSNRNEPVPDGLVDQVENDVNSIITFKRIVPRYPFFVLSILQMYEGYVPDDLTITSYAHCYQVLIMATLREAGISHDDNAINTSFNFAEKLALEIYEHSNQQTNTNFDFDEFVKKYDKKFLGDESIINRLCHLDFGIINKNGFFKKSYMYYFFLGKSLSEKSEENKELIKKMCEHSYVVSNYLTLLFIIHHTNDNELIDDILFETMCAFEMVQPAKLTQDETDSFKEIVNKLPENIRSEHSVPEGRKKERELRDVRDNLAENENDTDWKIDENPVNEIYRVLKNNEIMRQILRNRYGSMERVRIKVVIETIIESGLRLVKLGIKDRTWITDRAYYFHKKYPDLSLESIKNLFQFFSFLWTMINVEKVVESINVPGIKEIVNEVVNNNSTPAYDLIGYFYQLDSAKELTKIEKQDLETLLKKYNDFFLNRVLSIRTQHYMNTHRSDREVEQAICSLLNIDYTYTPLEKIHKPKQKSQRKRKSQRKHKN